VVESMPVSLRPVHPDDEDFLFRLFCNSVGDELNALAGPQRDAILRMQFNAQLQTYNAEFPKADHQIIMLDDRIIGRVLVERTESEHRGVDIALMPEYRSGGIGRMLIQELLDEAAAAGKPFRISVVRTNPALHLYDRLGFKAIGESLTHFMMEWVSEK
jgi:ribosomal protein S18 acetylase RimI-like enzyme